MGSRSPCEIHTVIVENCLSTGDALREIDRKVIMGIKGGLKVAHWPFKYMSGHIDSR